MRNCRIAGCSGTTTAWGTLCNRHKSRARRHGHPLQQSISKSDLKGHLAQVDEIIARNKHNPIWEMAKQRWNSLVDRSQAYLTRYMEGHPVIRQVRIASSAIVTIGDKVPFEEVLRTMCAVVLMHELEPSRFRSGEAFVFQMVRAIRRLTDVNAGSYFDPETGKVKRVYRDLSPKAVECMGEDIIAALGAVALKVARSERTRLEKVSHDKTAFQRAMEAVE